MRRHYTLLMYACLSTLTVFPRVTKRGAGLFHLEGTSAGHNCAIVNRVLHRAQAIPNRVLDLQAGSSFLCHTECRGLLV